MRTIKISAAIIENGVDYQEIKELARNYRAPFVVRTWASFLSQLRTISGKSTTLVTASISELEAIKAEPSTMSGFINFISDLVSSDIVIFLLEKKPGIIRGSLRSKTTDISKIANQFNGGGHKNASGFTFTGTIAEAEEAILKLL